MRSRRISAKSDRSLFDDLRFHYTTTEFLRNMFGLYFFFGILFVTALYTLSKKIFDKGYSQGHSAGYSEGYTKGRNSAKEELQEKFNQKLREIYNKMVAYRDEVERLKENQRRETDVSVSFPILLSSQKPLFVTGGAGTGKTTLLRQLHAFLWSIGKRAAVVAPTGIAALQAGGQTIHRFFGFDIEITEEKVRRHIAPKIANVLKNLDVLIIDEISMVRADLLDCVNAALQKARKSNAPFGGVQVIFFGDLYQLDPVVKSKEWRVFSEYYRSPFFFDAKVLDRQSMYRLDLEKIHRQSDKEFIRALNGIRFSDENLPASLRYINGKCFTEKTLPPPEDSVYLTPFRKVAERYNREKLSELKTQAQSFTGTVSGDFPDDMFPVPKNLILKEGAQVMFCNNDTEGHWVNGTIGQVREFTEIETDEGVYTAVRVEIKDEDGENDKVVTVEPFVWKNVSTVYDKENDRLTTEVVGYYVQLPLVLGWAFTIHKMQGKTLSKAVINFGRGAFTHGQAYVALSRVRSVDGLFLERSLGRKDVLTDKRVEEFLKSFRKIMTGNNFTLLEN